MKTKKHIIALALVGAMALLAYRPMPLSAAEKSFDQAAESVQQRLADSLAELKKLNEQTAAEKIPLSRRLNELEDELSDVRLKYQQTTRLLDSRTLDLTNLKTEIEKRREEALYLSNLLSEYTRNFESRLHIAEIQQYEDVLETAKLAPENKSLSQEEIYQAQAGLLTASLNRLHEALSGAAFPGSAVDDNGLIRQGAFVLVGPAAIFQSADGKHVGSVEQRLGSLEPSIVPFNLPEDALAAANLIHDSRGTFPLDPTLGNAHKIETTQETLLEHIKKGGLVMYPIFTLAGLALIVALYKFLTFLVLRMPSNQQIKALLDAVAKNDVISLKKHAASIMKARPRIFSGAARGAVAGLAFCGIACLIYQYVPATILWIWPDYEESQIASMPVVQLFLLSGLGFGVIGLVWSLLIYLLQQTFGYSPVGQTLAIGVEHIDEPRDLIEEVMYEKVLATRFRLNSMLSFISISAASAPLLGLLGTVTGIINTFKLITVFGSGDVKTLSGGISEALITTEFGLIVAIPSLLLHAFLSRKARGVIDQMEKAAISLANQISKTHRHATAAVSAEDLAITDSDKQDVSDAVDDALEDEDDYDMDSGELVEAGSNGSKKQSRPQRVPAAVMER